MMPSLPVDAPLAAAQGSIASRSCLLFPSLPRGSRIDLAEAADPTVHGVLDDRREAFNGRGRQRRGIEPADLIDLI